MGREKYFFSRRFSVPQLKAKKSGRKSMTEDFFTQGLDFKDATIGRRGYNILTVKQEKGVIDLRVEWDLTRPPGPRSCLDIAMVVGLA